MKKFIGYITAFAVGLIPGFFIVFNSIFSDSNGSLAERLTTFVMVIAAYGILGLVFGLIAPKKPWRWGVLLSLPAIFFVVFYSLKEKNVISLGIVYSVLTIASACYFSLMGALVRSKFSNQ